MSPAQAAQPHAATTDEQLFQGLTGAELAPLRPAADPRDVASPEALVRALHDAMSGPEGDWDEKRLLSLCLPNTTFAMPQADAQGKIHVIVVPVEALGRVLQKAHERSPWLERTLVRHITQRENIAVGYYNIDARKTPDGPVVQRGICICEMIYDGQRWWIASYVWEDIGQRAWPKDLDPAQQK